LEFSPLCHPSARLVVRGPRSSKWLQKDGSSAQHGLGFESSNVYSISQLQGAALPSADSADGRQSRQPITCRLVAVSWAAASLQRNGPRWPSTRLGAMDQYVIQSMRS